jgi:hypothetical protein
MSYLDTPVQARQLSGTTERRIELLSETAVSVPLTGVCQGGPVEQYGGKCITWVNLPAGAPVSVPIP